VRFSMAILNMQWGIPRKRGLIRSKRRVDSPAFLQQHTSLCDRQYALINFFIAIFVYVIKWLNSVLKILQLLRVQFFVLNVHLN